MNNDTHNGVGYFITKISFSCSEGELLWSASLSPSSSSSSLPSFGCLDVVHTCIKYVCSVAVTSHIMRLTNVFLNSSLSFAAVQISFGIAGDLDQPGSKVVLCACFACQMLGPMIDCVSFSMRRLKEHNTALHIITNIV